MSYQEQQLLEAVTARSAIMNLTARHDRAYSDGDRDRWVATFRHAGATYTRDGEVFGDLRSAFDGGGGQRLVSLDHEIHIDGINAVQRCIAVVFSTRYGDSTVGATGLFQDALIYERGSWFFASREIAWDAAPSRHRLVM